MKTLSDKCAHLLLRRGDDLQTLSVDLVPTTEAAIKKWDWTTRSSPIFLFEDVDYPDWTKAKRAYLVFVGPLDPALWEVDVPCYATLGTYNILAVCPDEDDCKNAVWQFLQGHESLQWEMWELEDGKILQVRHSATGAAEPIATTVTRSKVPHGLVPAEEENCTLFAAAIAKARRYMPEVAVELETFATAFRQQLEDAQGPGVNTKLSWIVNVNAALSRFTSQTFSGVSPISATECHFWSHSLLGVGLATQALVNIRRFTQTAVGDVDWSDLLNELGRRPLPKGWTKLFKRSPRNAESWEDAETETTKALDTLTQAATNKAPEVRLPHIVCFSGRDGFRSTAFSLSAPLEMISAGNAYGWTPITLSHEIAHVWIGSVLSAIFPDTGNVVEMERMERIAAGEGATTILDDLREAFLFAYKMLEYEREQIPMEQPIQKHWLALADAHAQQVNETLTHILDFQFFYHQDEVRYVKSIWASWDVIPNIKERLQSYVIRSACAILSERINHDDAIAASLERLETLLEELKNDVDQPTYIDDALRILREDGEALTQKIEAREMLVRLAKVFFTNRSIGARLQKEQQITGGVYSQLKPMRFDFQQIQNPMRFLGHYCKDRKGERAKTLWLLSKVAFMQDPNDTFS